MGDFFGVNLFYIVEDGYVIFDVDYVVDINWFIGFRKRFFIGWGIGVFRVFVVGNGWVLGWGCDNIFNGCIVVVVNGVDYFVGKFLYGDYDVGNVCLFYGMVEVEVDILVWRGSWVSDGMRRLLVVIVCDNWYIFLKFGLNVKVVMFVVCKWY